MPDDEVQHDYVKPKPKKWIHPNRNNTEDHIELPRFPKEFNINGPPRGKPHSLAPLRIYLEKDKEYHW